MQWLEYNNDAMIIFSKVGNNILQKFACHISWKNHCLRQQCIKTLLAQISTSFALWFCLSVGRMLSHR